MNSIVDEGGMNRRKVTGVKGLDGGSETYFLEITKTPIPDQQTIVLNESLRWILYISCAIVSYSGSDGLTSGAKMTLSIVSN